MAFEVSLSIYSFAAPNSNARYSTLINDASLAVSTIVAQVAQAKAPLS